MSKTMAGTPTTMHMSGWKTESMARYYSGAITSTMVAGAKRQRVRRNAVTSLRGRFRCMSAKVPL